VVDFFAAFFREARFPTVFFRDGFAGGVSSLEADWLRSLTGAHRVSGNPFFGVQREANVVGPPGDFK